jgi:nucleoside-diphosphate-sugar epimerase
MANYLVTGAAGFIASRVAEMLLDAGHTVVGVDNLNDAYDVSLKEHRLAVLQGRDRFRFQRMDISDKAILDAEILNRQPFEAVINLAARAGVRQSTLNPWVYVETNMTGTLNMLELCRQKGIPKFVLASTSSLYGAINPLPFSEDADTNHPLSPYAASKKGAEALCYTYHYLYGLDITVFRYFTVYGPAGRPDMSMFRFTQWIREGKPVQVYGDGGSRDFSYVDDIARGTILGLKPLGYEVINLGGDRPFEIQQVIRLIEQETGCQAQVVHLERNLADVPATWANIEKARRLLGWQPQVRLEEGIARLVAWYDAEREWAREVNTD